MKYFTIAELCASGTATARGIDNTPGAEAVANLTNLVNYLLDPLREMYGKPIRVNSGYRCPKLNSAVGGSATSEHRYGMAADIDAGSKAENKKLFELIKNNFEYGQLIDERDYAWVHVSFNPQRMRNQGLRYNGSTYTTLWAGKTTPNPLTPGNTINGVKVGADLQPDSSDDGTSSSKKKVLLISAACISLAVLASVIIYIMYKRKRTTI